MMPHLFAVIGLEAKRPRRQRYKDSQVNGLIHLCCCENLNPSSSKKINGNVLTKTTIGAQHQAQRPLQKHRTSMHSTTMRAN